MKLTYRPEIDGLRAIAVGAVILYHAQINILGHQPFKGGFIGVDIFFVISGYLITSIILKELVTTGSFSFKYFYERRLRRILPALLFVMLASLPFAWMYLLPDTLIDFSKSIFYSLGFSSNFYFYYSDQQYGAESSLLKPFLHTWSLSVEEQFYILFPIVLLITFIYQKKYLVYVLIVIFVVSFGLANWSSINYPFISFYFFHTRIWELLAGSILSYFEIIRGYRIKNNSINSIFPKIGLLLIVHSIIFFDNGIYHPSFQTLSPIIGTCLIIWFSDKNEFITKILSSNLFVGIGLISYSLYLWHYPIFAFARITYFFEDNILREISIGLIILILSILTYYFIEKPFRNKKNSFKKILIIVLSIILFIIFLISIVLKENGFKNRIPKIFQAKFKSDDIKLYQRENTQKVILIGDSHANALVYNLNEKMKENDLSFFRYPTIMYIKHFKHIIERYNDRFIQENKNIDNFLKKNSNLIVIFHQRWSWQLDQLYFDNKEVITEYSKLTHEERIRKSLMSQIKSIIDMGHKLILVYPVPRMNFIPDKLLYKKHLFESNFFKNPVPILSSSYETYKNDNKLIFKILDTIQSPNIYRVYPNKLFCDNQIKKKCVANDENNIFYYDENHLTIQGSKLIVDKIIDKINKIKKKSN